MMKRTRPSIEHKCQDLSRSPSTVLESHYFDEASAPLHYDYIVDTIVDRLGVMLEKQSLYFECLSASHDDPPGRSHNVKWRGHMLEWYFEVIDHTEHDRSVAALAINFLDRFWAERSIGGELNQRDYSLAAMTCLTLASKLYLSRHNSNCHISINYVLRLAHGSYSRKDVESSELDLLATLKWLVHPPIVPEFIEYLFHLMPRWENDRVTRITAFEHARYASELALVSCVPHSEPARMAFACILSGFQEVPSTIRNVFVRNVAYAVGLTPEDVTPERESVAFLIRSVKSQQRWGEGK